MTTFLRGGDLPLIDVARGKVRNASAVHKFGATPEISVSVTATIWDKADTLYPWSTFDGGAVTLNVDSSSASDVGQSVTIEGLDDDFNLLTETVLLTTQTNNNSSNQFRRVYRAYMSDTVSNVGNISIQSGSTDVAIIRAGKAQTLMAIYTVPAGYTGYILTGDSTVKAGSDMTLYMYARYGGTGPFRIGHQAEVSPNGYNYQFQVPLVIPEKTDIDVRGRANTNNIRSTAVFDILLIKENTTSEWSSGY